ncbi:hypothetical protein [Sulfurimonas sp.]
MNKLLTAFTILISLFFISCSNMQTGFDEDSMFYQGTAVNIYIDQTLPKSSKYKLYINNVLSDATLKVGKITKLYLSTGKTRISIVKDRQTAEINLDIKELERYILRVQDNDAKKIELIQMQSYPMDEGNAVKEDLKVNEPKTEETSFSYERDDE